MSDRWELFLEGDARRPATHVLEGERFYVVVGPDAGYPRDIPRPTIARQRWQWEIRLLGKVYRRFVGQYRVEAEGHAPTRAKARACALAVLRVLEGTPA